MNDRQSIRRLVLIAPWFLAVAVVAPAQDGEIPLQPAAADRSANEPTGATSPTVLELIPDNAALAIGVTRLSRLKSRGDRLFEATDARGLRISELFSHLYAWLGVGGLIDEERPAVGVLANLRQVGVDQSDPINMAEAIVFRLPVRDLDKVAEKFGLDEDAIATGQIVPRGTPRPFAVNCACYRDGYLLLAMSRKGMESVLKSTPVAAELSDLRRKAVDEADVVVLAGTHPWADAWTSFVEQVESEEFIPQHVPQAEEIKRFLRETVHEARFVLFTANVEDGLHVRLAAHFTAGGRAEAVLSEIRGDVRSPASLGGLPQRNILGAVAARGPQLRSMTTARLMIPLALRGVTPPEFLEKNDPTRMLGTFDGVWQQLDGVQMALYATDAATTTEIADRGLMAGVFVLQGDQPRRLISSIAQEGIRLGGDPSRTENADASSRISVRLIPDRETVAGYPVDHLEIDTGTVDADTAAALRNAFGPAWMILQAARLENEVVVLLGSETRWLAETLAVRKTSTDDLAQSEPFTRSQSRLDAAHQAALYVSLQRTMPAASGFERGIAEMNSPIDRISSGALTVEQNALQIEFWLPLAEIRAIPQKWRRFWW